MEFDTEDQVLFNEQLFYEKSRQRGENGGKTEKNSYHNAMQLVPKILFQLCTMVVYHYKLYSRNNKCTTKAAFCISLLYDKGQIIAIKL